MKKLASLLLLILITQTSCNIKVDDCKNIDCTTPPPTFRFEFIDKNTKENLFTNKTFDIKDVSVTDEKGKDIKFELITENNINVLDVSEIGWTIGPKSYTIELNTKSHVAITLNMKDKFANCCSFFEVIEFSVLDYEYDRSTNTGVIVVKI